MKCHAPLPAGEAHEITPGQRFIAIPTLTVNWGDKDIRDEWTGGYLFCSFACLAKWAAEKAADHDHVVLTEGKAKKR